MSTTPPSPDPERTRRSVARVGYARVLGLAATAIGVVAGIVMMVRRREVTCADGTYFPEGTEDFRCFSHPLLAQGVAVTAICLALAALIVICGEMATHNRAEPS